VYFLFHIDKVCNYHIDEEGTCQNDSMTKPKIIMYKSLNINTVFYSDNHHLTVVPSTSSNYKLQDQRRTIDNYYSNLRATLVSPLNFLPSPQPQSLQQSFMTCKVTLYHKYSKEGLELDKKISLRFVLDISWLRSWIQGATWI